MTNAIRHLSQSGSSIIENTISVLLLCLIALGLIESAHWLLVRQVLNAALLDTARIAVTQQAHPTIIHEAFLEQLSLRSSFHFKPEQRYWSIEHRTLAPAMGSVRHSYQALQYQQGNHQVFAQNTLALRLRYGHRPLSPLLRTLVRYSSVWQHSSHAALSQQGLIPIVTELHLSMQSDQPRSEAGTIEPQALPKPISEAKPHALLSSLIFSEQSPKPLLAWSPNPALNNPPDASCDANYCCDAPF